MPKKRKIAWTILSILLLTTVFSISFNKSRFEAMGRSQPSTMFSDDFSADSGMWEYLGSAYRDPINQYLVLTEATGDQAGVAFFNVSFRECFTANFTYKVGGGSGGDGFAVFFYKQNYSTFEHGGGLGFIGIYPNLTIPGYGIEFDGWQNIANPNPPPYEHGDPSPDHIALIKDWVGNHLIYVDDPRVKDNNWHNVSLTVGYSSVKVIVDEGIVFMWNGTIDRSFNCFGFCGATGGATNWHIIDNLTLEVDQPVEVPTDFPTIQEAINNANEGDIIFVKNGTYYENVVLNKSLSLVGESKSSTIVDGRSGTVVFKVTAGKVKISGFTVQNGFEGISLTSNSNNVTDNIVMNNEWAGIYLSGASGNVISDNTIVDTAGSAWWYGVGIFLDAFNSYNTIVNNTLDSNTWGIILEGSDHNTLRGNRILNSTFGFDVETFFDEDIDTSNLIDGRPIYYLPNQKDLVIDNLTFPNVGFLGIVDSENITVRDLELHNNGQGILLANTNNSIIENLGIQNNKIGIHLYYSMNNTINGNSVAYNKIVGIYLENCERNTIKCNMISDNFAGLGMTSENKNNMFYHNSFVNNEKQTNYLSRGPINAEDTWDNGYPSGGNYWSDNNGTDSFFGPYQNLTGTDGIGDIPYTIDENNTDHYPLMSPYEYWSNPILGDVNRDTKVDMGDIVQLCDGFGSVLNSSDGYYWHRFKGQPCPLCPHSPNLDIDGNGRIDMGDIVTALDNFGQHYP